MCGFCCESNRVCFPVSDAGKKFNRYNLNYSIKLPALISHDYSLSLIKEFL